MFASRKLLALFLIALVAISFTRAQADAQPNAATDAQPEDAAGAGHEQLTEEQQNQMIELQRAKLWGCYFLAKHRLFTKSEKLSALLTGTKADALFKRMVTDIMKTCLNNIQPEQSQKIISSLGSQEFNIDDWNDVHNFNVDLYTGDDVQLNLSEEEKFLYSYYTKIDENLRNQYEEQAEKEDADRRKTVDYEPKLGGFSLKDASPFTKTLYAAIVLGSIAVLFFFAYKKLFSSEESPYEKVKRERAEKKKRDKSK